jgi:hypothetical protein
MVDMSLIAQYIFDNNANDSVGNYQGTPSNVAYQDKPAGFCFPGLNNNANSTVSVLDGATYQLACTYSGFGGFNNVRITVSLSYHFYPLYHIKMTR